jgi:hypothetical protein
LAKGVTIDLIVDPKKAIQGLARVESKSSSVANALGRIGHVAAAGVAVLGAATLAAGAATVAFVGEAVKSAAEAEKITAQTGAVITSTGGAAGRSAGQIDSLASSLSRISGISNETIRSGENLLLTFTNIKGTTFDEATASALDLSVAMGTDLQDSVLQLGKALNDPIKGVTRLQRIGVTFTATQKQQIANYVKLGETAKAQQVIIDEVNREFGGSAAAFGNTFEGAVGKARTAINDLRIDIGSGLLPALTAGVSSVAGVLTAIAENPKFNTFLAGLSSRFTAGLKPLTDFLTTVAGSEDPFGALLDGLEKISPAFQIVRDVFDSLKPEIPEIQAAFQQLGSALGAGLAQYGPQLAVAFTQIVAAVVPLLPQILALIPPVLDLIPPLLLLATEVIPPLVSVLGALIPPLQFIIDGFTGGLQAVGDFFGFLSGNTSLTDFAKQIDDIKGPFGDLQNFIHDVAHNIVQGIVALVDGIKNAFSGAAGFLTDAGRNLIQGFVNGITGAFKAVQSTLRKLFGGAVDLVKSILGIHSPSTIFAGFGTNVVLGLQQGLTGPNNLGGIMSDLSGQVTDGFQGAITASARATLTTATSGNAETSGGLTADPQLHTLMRNLIAAVGNIRPGWIVPEDLSQINRTGSGRLATIGAS